MKNLQTFDEFLNESYKPKDKLASQKFKDEVIGVYLIRTPEGKDTPKEILDYSKTVPLIKRAALRLRDSDDLGSYKMWIGVIAWSTKKADIDAAKKDDELITSRGVKVFDMIGYGK